MGSSHLLVGAMHGGDALCTGVMTEALKGLRVCLWSCCPHKGFFWTQALGVGGNVWIPEGWLNLGLDINSIKRRQKVTEFTSRTVCLVSTSSRMGLVTITVIQKWKLNFCKSEFLFVKRECFLPPYVFLPQSSRGCCEQFRAQYHPGFLPPRTFWPPSLKVRYGHQISLARQEPRVRRVI